MIVLDTHIWLWWLNEDYARVQRGWINLIDESDNVAVSAISCFEVAWLERHSRVSLPGDLGDWFEKALGGSDIDLLPITPEIAKIAVDLPEHHTDPQDRLIMATAISYDAQLISADKKFRDYKEIAHLLVPTEMANDEP